MKSEHIFNRGSFKFTICALSLTALLATNTGQASSVPSILSVNPISAPTGASVTITGTGFDSVPTNDIVYFGAVRAIVTSASSTNLAVTVPAGATYAPITITVGGLVGYASAAYEPTFIGNDANIDASTFAPGFNLATPSGPIQVALADLDGDGKADLVVANGYAKSISIYQNISAGGSLSPSSFASPIILPVGTGNYDPFFVVAADVDGDGKIDIVAPDSSGSQVVIFRNLSSGGTLTTNSFAPPVSLAVNGDPRKLAVRDLDGDGRPDIVTANFNAGTISILRNIGTPGSITTNSFAASVELAVGAGPDIPAIVDLDGDGRPDLVVPGTTISIFRNLSSPGTITTNSFAPRIDLPGPGLGLAVGDVDGDGKPDLIFGDYLGESMSVYRNLSSSGSLSAASFAGSTVFVPGGRFHVCALGDFNGDGKPDIAVVTELPSHLSIYQNLSTPGAFTNTSLAARVDYPSGWNAWGVAVGDLDGDGRPDVVFANSYDGTLTIYQNATPFGGSPVITSQPSDQTVFAGGTAAFTVDAGGMTPLSFQWSFNGTNIAWGTNATLTLTNVQSAQAGNYAVLVTNTLGWVLSSNALLSLVYPPTITSQPHSLTLQAGKTATFSVTATGSLPLRYQWYLNGGLLSGKTGSILTLGNVQSNQQGSYSVTVSNTYGVAISSNALLTVLPGPIPVPPPAGLVAWWRAESNTLDTIGINDATAMSQPALYMSGKVGTAFSLSGGYLQVPASSSLDLGGGDGLTIEGWIWPNSSSTTEPIAEWNDSRGNIGVGLMLNGAYGPGLLAAYLTDTNIMPARVILLGSSTYAVTNAGWQHVALTLDRTSGIAALYLNGFLVSQANLGAAFLPATKAPFYLGWRPSGMYGGSRFSGGLDEFSLYNRALSAGEIQSIVLASDAGKVPPPQVCLPAPTGIVGWWRGESNALDSIDGDNGIATNSVTYAPGQVGAGFQLSSSYGSYVRVPAATNLNVGAGPGLTLELCVKATYWQSQPLVEWNSGTGTQGVYIAHGSMSGTLEAGLADTQGVQHVFRSPLNLFTSAGVWQHVALTYDKSSGLAALYFNGSVVAQTNFGSFTPRTDSSLYFGYRPPGSYYGSGSRFSGMLDEISLYGRALAASEIQAIAMSSRTLGKCAEAPWIYTQPASVVSLPHSNATFSVTAGGTPNLRYQWRRTIYAAVGATDIPGATSSSLTITNVCADAGLYSVCISNTFGFVISSNALLVINRAPVARAVDVMVAAGSNCVADATIDSGSFDPDGDVITLTQTPPGPYPLGTNLVTLTVTDTRGASNSCGALVIVLDRTPPVLTCPANIVVTNAHDSATSIVTFSPTVWDNCSDVGTPVCTPPSGSAFAVGAHNVSVIARDAAGNLSRGSFTVTVLSGNAAPVPVIEVAPLLQFAGSSNLMVIAPDGRQAKVYFDASRSYDPNKDLSRCYWYAGTNFFSTNVVASRALKLGTNEITLQLDDTFPLGESSASVEVEVISPAKAAGVVIDLVKNSKLVPNRQQPLLANLTAAQRAFAQDRLLAGVVSLYSFRMQVRALVVKLDPALADALLHAADQIVNALIQKSAPATHLTYKGLTVGSDSWLHLKFDGTPARVYLVQASNNKKNWETIGVAHDNGDGTFDFDDFASARFPNRSYRILAP